MGSCLDVSVQEKGSRSEKSLKGEHAAKGIDRIRARRLENGEKWKLIYEGMKCSIASRK